MKKSSIKVKAKPQRILLGPLDSGLNYDLKMGLLGQGFKVTTMNFVANRFDFQSDIVLKINQMNFIQAVLTVFTNFFKSFSYDLYHFRFGQSLLPWNLDLPLWKIIGKKIVMSFEGSDIRLSRNFCKTKYNVLFSKNTQETLSQRIKKLLRYQWIKIWADRITVSTPDLLEFAPAAELVYNIVPLRIKKNSKRTVPNTNKTIKILHAPTNRSIKGTKYIIKAVKRLQKEHCPVELIIFENKPHIEIDSYYRQTDIVIDQLLMGALSTVSLEGMMYGKPVICYVREDLRCYYPPDLPVISANSDNIYLVLKRLLDEKNKLNSIGQNGLSYIKKYHYPNVVGKKWKGIYLDL